MLDFRLSFVTSFLLIVLIFQSCKPTGSTGNSSVKSDPISITSVRQFPYKAANTRFHDLLHTKLDLSFDWQKQYVNGLATLTFTPYFYPQDSLVLDAKGFDIHSISLKNGDVSKDLVYKYDQKKLRIKLDREYSRKDTFTIAIDYTAKPNEIPAGGSEAITSDKGLYFINPDGSEPYKPRQIWTQGETEANSKWFPTIDSPNEKTTQEMFITVDTSFTVLTNGEFVYSLNNGDGTKSEYWKMVLPHAPYLFMMAIGEYSIVEDSWNEKPVNYYVEPAYKSHAKAVFGNTPEMIGFFSDKLQYPYPWNKYSQVVVRDFVSGAMENTTATIFMEALQIDDREALDVNWDYIIAHELFHHWFGDLVTCESWSNLPLNESFANYSEYLWIEHKYGKDEADYHGENEIREYLEEAQNKQVPLIRYHYNDPEDMFDRHSYNKGGRVLHMLRNFVGDEAFFASLNHYLRTHEFTPVEIHELRLSFEEITGMDLNWFFNQWFFNPGHPVINVQSSFDNGEVKLIVEQLQDTTNTPIYRLPLKVDIWEAGRKTTHSITISKQKEKFSFPVSTQPQLVIFDSEFILLGEKSHQKTVDELIFQYRNSDRYLGRMEALSMLVESSDTTPGLNSKLNDPKVRTVLLEALNDKFWAIRDLVLNLFFEYSIPQPEYFVSAIEKLAKSDTKPEVRANAIFFLSKYFNEKYVEVYKAGLKERPYSVVSASLASYLKTGDKSVDLDFTEFEKIRNLEITLTLANYYLSNKDATKYAWFKEKMIRNKSNPRAIYNLLFFFGEYLALLPESERADGKIIIKEIRDSTKYEVIKQLAQKYLSGTPDGAK